MLRVYASVGIAGTGCNSSVVGDKWVQDFLRHTKKVGPPLGFRRLGPGSKFSWGGDNSSASECVGEIEVMVKGVV